jgi:hypothetical protein
MEEEKMIEIGKEAYVLSEQLLELEQVMKRKEPSVISGCSSYAKNFSSVLDKAKKILEVDLTILKTISHLTSYDPGKGV